MMKEPIFTGVCTALVTPFLDGKVNYPMLEQLLRRQLEAGIKAIVIAGTTGEAPTLTDCEKLTLFKKSKEFVKGDCKIIAGTGSNCTQHAVDLSCAAQEAGADGLLVVSPYYNKATPDGLVAHYGSIAQHVSIPIILYNVPSRTGLDIPVSVYRELSSVPEIVGIKEAAADITKITEIRGACGPDFLIWTGNDTHITPAVAMGCKGVISVMSNLYPMATRIMTEAALDGDFDTASDLQVQFRKLLHLLFKQVNPVPIKAAMKLIGYDCGTCRLPLTAPDGNLQTELESYLKRGSTGLSC
jgi:4-hydroxy-tetrahydrodipicolinate synthase